MARINLENYLLEDNESLIDEDELLLSLEQVSFLLMDDEDFALEQVSLEETIKEKMWEGVKSGGGFVAGTVASGLSSAGKSILSNLKDFVEDLISGSESINNKYKKKLRDMEDLASGLEGKERRSISSLSGIVYSEKKKAFLVDDLSGLLKSDLEFVKSVIKIVEQVDSAMDDNLKLFEKVLNVDDSDAFIKMMKKDIQPNLKTVGEIYSKNKFRGDVLYNSTITIPDSKSQTHTFLELSYKSGMAGPKARFKANLRPYMTSADAKKIFSQVIELADLTEELVDMMKDFEQKYNVITGPVFKKLVEIESEMVEKIGLTSYRSGIDLIVPINVGILKTIDRLPRVTISRNIKIMKVFTVFGNKLLKGV